MKQRRVDGTGIYEYLCRIFDNLEIRGKERERYCQFKGKDGRFCKATTQKSCKRCRFFSPATQTKIMAIIEHDLQLEEDIRRVKVKNMTLENKVEYLEKEIKKVHEYYRDGLGDYTAVGKSIARHRRKLERVRG